MGTIRTIGGYKVDHSGEKSIQLIYGELSFRRPRSLLEVLLLRLERQGTRPSHSTVDLKVDRYNTTTNDGNITTAQPLPPSIDLTGHEAICENLPFWE